THLQSLENEALIEKLSMFLGHPVLDPHGEPIPDKNGHFQNIHSMEILDLKMKQPATIFGYRESGKEFLEYLEKLNLLIGSEIQVISLVNYDHSLEVLIENNTKRMISKETAQKIYVRILENSNLK
ncbi:MAG TPA: FeoA domain-containing protein, partial [Nitrosopumilaceae archaeon]|nr:FeoA domain-containing protein [Nitrosopumilaceae archaeon]